MVTVGKRDCVLVLETVRGLFVHPLDCDPSEEEDGKPNPFDASSGGVALQLLSGGGVVVVAHLVVTGERNHNVGCSEEQYERSKQPDAEPGLCAEGGPGATQAYPLCEVQTLLCGLGPSGTPSCLRRPLVIDEGQSGCDAGRWGKDLLVRGDGQLEVRSSGSGRHTLPKGVHPLPFP
jgi:hypothetical protein